jgi:hypothetical protein
MHAHLEEVGDLWVGRADQTPLVVGLPDYFLTYDFPERFDVDLLFGFLESLGERPDELFLG